MSNSASSDGMPVSTRQSWFSRPELGAASISQAMAPTNGGVTRLAITRVRTVRRIGMSVRATSQPNGAATMQQIVLTETAMNDQRGDQRIDEARIGEQGDEVAERRGYPACRQAVDHQPAHRQDDHHRQQRGDGDQDGARKIEPGHRRRRARPSRRGRQGCHRRTLSSRGAAEGPSHTLKIRVYFALISSAIFSTSAGSSRKVLIEDKAGRPTLALILGWPGTGRSG